MTDKYIQDNVINEDLILKDLNNVLTHIDDLTAKMDKLYILLTGEQQTIISNMSYKYNQKFGTEEKLKMIMDCKKDIEDIVRKKLYPLYYFANNANHLSTLKKYINEDEYLKNQWDEILAYMRLKD